VLPVFEISIALCARARRDGDERWGRDMSDPTTRTRRPPAWSAQHKERQRLAAAVAESREDTVSQFDIDESLEESFPASDPPSWIARLRIGAPRRRN
jgi:hypothetical protein